MGRVVEIAQHIEGGTYNNLAMVDAHRVNGKRMHLTEMNGRKRYGIPFHGENRLRVGWLGLVSFY